MFRTKDRPSSAPTIDALRPERAQLQGVPILVERAASSAPGEAADLEPVAAAESPKLLIVGHDISLAGEITACDRLVVEGSVKVTLNQTRAIEITETGRFLDGKAEVEEAVISGVYEGELTVRGRLLIRSTGKVRGDVRYGELEIERGGCLAGSIDVHVTAKRAPAPGTPPNAPMAERPAGINATAGGPAAAKLSRDRPASAA